MSYVPRPERPERPGSSAGRRNTGRPHSAANMLACGLGFASIGFGLLQLLAPRARGRGPADRHRGGGLLRLDGLVEAGIGLGLLMGQSRRDWMWSRALNHAFQAGLLIPRLGRGNPHRVAAGTALGGLVASLAVDALCARQLGVEERPARSGVVHDYSGRSGFPQSPDKMRGAARR